MNKNILFAGALALSLGGCALFGGTPGTCSSDPICVAEQGVTAGYQSYTFFATEAVAAHNSGLLNDATFAVVRTDLDTGKHYLDLAYAATTAAEITADLAKGNAALAKAQTDGSLKGQN